MVLELELSGSLKSSPHCIRSRKERREEPTCSAYVEEQSFTNNFGKQVDCLQAQVRVLG
jgi:hypothetical protein